MAYSVHQVHPGQVNLDGASEALVHVPGSRADTLGQSQAVCIASTQ